MTKIHPSEDSMNVAKTVGLETVDTLTIEQFITKHAIIFSCHEVDERKDGLMVDSPRHFRCKISKAHKDKFTSVRSFSVYFSQGSAHTVAPTLADVLDCLASDASGYESSRPASDNRSPTQWFAYWASEYGYDTDSRKAEKTFKSIKRSSEQMKRTLGAEAFEELLYNTERM